MDEELKKLKKKKMKELMRKIKGVKMEANDANFKEKVIEQSKKIPVIADFWAPWCQPCLMLSPVLEKLAEEYKGKFILAKVNVDGAQVTSTSYGIRGIPSVKLFKDGKIIDEFVGALPESQIREWLNKNLGE